MKRLARHRLKSFSDERLIRHALRHWHADAGWRAIQALHLRGSPALLETITAMSTSPRARRRAVALAIAGQLMHRLPEKSDEHGDPGNQGDHHDPASLTPRYEMHAESATQQLLLRGLADPHPDVVRAAVLGLGHRPHGASVDALLRLASSTDRQMRWQVAVALGSYEEPEAIAGLIRLSADSSDDVRDWATFGLGSLRDDDSPEIRAALRRNLDDPDLDVRGEALVGLARRREDGLVERLIARLTPDCHVYELDAAEALADPRLVGPLRALADARTSGAADPYWRERLQDALDACVPFTGT